MGKKRVIESWDELLNHPPVHGEAKPASRAEVEAALKEIEGGIAFPPRANAQPNGWQTGRE